jgi:hypothetical protein
MTMRPLLPLVLLLAACRGELPTAPLAQPAEAEVRAEAFRQCGNAAAALEPPVFVCAKANRPR